MSVQVGLSCCFYTLKNYVEKYYDAEIKLLKEVDYTQDDTVACFIDCGWRSLLYGDFLSKVPFSKRVLLLLEPKNVNPAAYYVPWIRNKFSKVITWDENLLKRNNSYFPIVVNPFEEPIDYQTNRFDGIAFSDKKLVVAIAAKRRMFLNLGNHKCREKVYRYFDEKLPNDFDLYGRCWDASTFKNSYRGPLNTDSAGKVAKMANYRFALCYENNVNQPGYVSEKISDCICARCVPIYHGSDGIEERVPLDCFVDARQFKTLDNMIDFMISMSEAEHSKYISAMDKFCRSDLAMKFTRKYFVDMFASALGLEPKRT